MATMRLIGRTILSLIILTGLSPWAVPASRAEAATYYVGTSGNDGNPGTEARPLKTLQQAANKVKPGDTVIVRGGRYAGLSKSNFHGAPGSPITFKAAPGERVTLDAFLSTHRCGIIALGGVASYLVFDGFELVNTNPVLARMRQLDLNNRNEFAEYVRLYPPFRCNHGVRMESSPSNSHHLTFQNMEIHHGGIAFSGGISFGQFLNNNVHDMSYGWYVGGDQNVWRGNNIHHGIFGFHLRTGITNSIIENNLIHHNGMISHIDFTDDPPRLQHDGTGIWIRGASNNNIIRNNLIFNNGPRGGYGGISVVGSGNKIYNNTLYGNNIGINRYNSDVAIRNNIIYGNGKAIVPPLPDANQHNNLTTDPKFVNADGADFRLQPSSPAINAGTPLPEVPCDIEGNRRPAGSAYDIGAYEYGSTHSGSCIGSRR